MNKTLCVLIAVVAASGGCASKPTAIDVCKKIEAAGVGSNCHADQPGGLGAAAVEKAVFDLPSVPGKTGQVLRFDRETFFTNTEEAFGKVPLLSGPHRYGSKKALIFVQANDKLSADAGAKLKAVVDAL